MIQFNLLPDVKLNYIKAKKTKKTAVFVSTAAGGTVVLIVVLLFLAVNVFQKQHLNDLNSDIKKYSNQLNNTTDLNKILTIQNQLKSLPQLHDKKAVATRLFTYLSQVTPAQASIAQTSIDFKANTLSISGSADSLNTINQFADTLKFTKYKAGDQTGSAFSNVVLTSFSHGDKDSSYQLNVAFDAVIFDSANDVTLSVPHIISTRSETEKPTDLFQKTNTGSQ
jgi:Tfp pilus assembly protein PilN